MFKFLQNKISLIIWSLVFITLSVSLFLLLIYYGVASSYPSLSDQAMKLQQAMFNLKMDIGQTNVQKRLASLPEDFTGINCKSNDKIEKDCDIIKSITGQDVQIFTSKNNFCFSIKYEPGFYNKSDKLDCESFNDASLHGVCDEKSVSCLDVPRTKKSVDLVAIILLIGLFISMILSIIFIVRLFFTSVSGGLTLILLIFVILIILFFFLSAFTD